MATDLIPVVDLRLLSQHEISAIAASSSSVASADPSPASPPRIDRSVFNESAGSRKQTYSRLRLAPRDPNPSASPLPRRRGRPRSTPAPPAATPSDDPGRHENRLIVSFLRHLFARHEPPPQQPQTLPPTGPNNNQNATNLVEERDKVVLNAKGIMVNLVELGTKVDPYGEELRRRTEGLGSAEQLLGYLSGLDGQWGSRRRRKKIVDAARFGDHLPKGWKLLIGVRRKEGIARLDCRKYISPSGKKFVSCKEVSSYILSLVGHQEARQTISQFNESTSKHAKLTPLCNAGTIHHGIRKENASCSSYTPFYSISADHGKQLGLLKFENQANIEQRNILECHKCNLTFDNKDAHMQHMLSSHKRNTKRRRLGKTIGDGVIVKDGKYECQYCHKTFSERRPYYGHIGAHVRYQGLSAGALPEVAIRNSAGPSSLTAAPHVLSGMNVPDKKSEENHPSEISFSKPIHEEQIDPSHCRPEMENHEMNLNPMHDVPVTQVITSKFVDDNNAGCNTASNKSQEIVGTRNVTDLSSTASDVISASSVYVINMMKDHSPKVTEDASMGKCVDDLINNHEIADCRNKEVIEAHSGKGIDPNPCVDDTSFAINTDNTYGDILNRGSLSCSMLKSDDGDITKCNENDTPEELPKPSSVMDAKPNECMDALPPSLTGMNNTVCGTLNGMDVSSCTMNSKIEKYDSGQKVGSESNLISLSGNRTSFGIETFITGMYTNPVEGNALVEMATSINEMECDSVGGQDRSAIIQDTLHVELRTNNVQEIDLQSCVFSPFGNGPDQDFENNTDCTLPSNLKESFLEETNQPCKELENCFDIGTSGRCEDAVTVAIKNNVVGDAMQVDVADASSSWVQSTAGPSILDMIPDQCEDETIVVGQKHNNISSFDMEPIDPSNLILLSCQELTSVTEPQLELGLVGQLENRHQPSEQLEWDLSSATIDDSCELTSLCVWCGGEFKHEAVSAELQSDSLGFICPTCKAKISGQLNADGFSG